MTDFNRSVLPDAVRSNGATPNPWWAKTRTATASAT